MIKNLTLAGAVLGIVSFFVIGLLPAMAYGGYAGLLLAQGLGFGSRLITVFGMAMGVFGVGSLFAVLGAVLGTACGALLSPLAARRSDDQARNVA